MNILELFGNLPYTIFGSPSPQDYYKAGYEQHKREQDEEQQRMRMARCMYKKLEEEIKKGETKP